jgi:hypothetical protein
MCSEPNPLTNLKRMPMGEFQARGRPASALGPIPIRTVESGSTCWKGVILTGVRTVETEATFIRMLKYLGATSEQM